MIKRSRLPFKKKKKKNTSKEPLQMFDIIKDYEMRFL